MQIMVSDQQKMSRVKEEESMGEGGDLGRQFMGAGRFTWAMNPS